MCDPDQAHYTYRDAVVAADYEWTLSRTWMQVTFCTCEWWILLKGVASAGVDGEHHGQSLDEPEEGCA